MVPEVPQSVEGYAAGRPGQALASPSRDRPEGPRAKTGAVTDISSQLIDIPAESAVLLLTLLVFAFDVAVIIAFTVARYHESTSLS